MSRLLKYEMKKWLHAKAIYVGVVLTVILSIIAANSNILIAAMTSSSNYILQQAISLTGFDLVLTIIIPIMICEEFSNGTMKLIVARGFSREKILLSKLITVMVYTLILTVVCIGVNVCTAAMKGIHFDKVDGMVFLSLAVQFLIMLTEAIFAFSLSVIAKKKSTAIAISVIAPYAISIALMMVDLLLEKANLSSYWIASFMTRVSDEDVTLKMIGTTGAFSLLYIAVFVVLGFMFVHKSDL